jgi:carnitine 3-dehydrogenase
MLNQKPEDVRHITCIGAGPIGGGWAAHYLAQGYLVTSYLHDASEHKALMRLIENAWVSLEEIGLVDGASLDNFSWTTDLAKATEKAEFIQESIPEILELKQTLYQKLGEIVDPQVVIASSTSGLSMTDIQVNCATPKRTVVAHPFNPPYLLPLVEMIGGERTAPETLAWTEQFYKIA